MSKAMQLEENVRTIKNNYLQMCGATSEAGNVNLMLSRAISMKNMSVMQQFKM
jgi:hypothetical protein